MPQNQWWSPFQRQTPARGGRVNLNRNNNRGGPPPTNNLDPAAFLRMLQSVPNPLASPLVKNVPTPLEALAALGGQTNAAMRSVPVPNIGMPNVPVDNIAAQMGRGLAAPMEQAARGIFAPQGQDEPFWMHTMRSSLGAPIRAGKAVAEQVGSGIADLAGRLGSTPASAFFDQAIVAQESGGRQFDAQGNPLVGRDRQGRVPGAARGGPAIGGAQIQEATARNTAKQHGLPWDPARWKSDKEYNLLLGRLHFNDLAKNYGGDLQLAAAAYHSGEPNVNRALQQHGRTGFVQGLGPEGQNYVQIMTQKLAGLADNFGAPAPAFDPSPFQNAMEQSQRAADLQSAPWKAAFDDTPLPPRPAPTELQSPDYTAGDTAFEATRPTNPFDDPKEKVRVQKQQFFKGIGQAMASLSGNEGIGTMLMKMGAGALMGRARGDEMIDEREIEFEKNMQEFNRALANREDQKATNVANVLNQNIQQRNEHANNIWADNVAQIKRFQPQVVGDRLVTYKQGVDPENPNRVEMTSVQLGYGPDAEAALRSANIGMQMGAANAESARFAYSSGQATARTALGVATQLALSQGDTQAAGEGYLTQATMQARAAVQTGSWRQLFVAPERANQLEAEATETAMAAVGHTNPKMPLDGSKATAYRQVYEDTLTNIVYREAARLGQIDRLLTHSAGRNALQTQRSGTERINTRTGPKGTTTTRSWSLDE